jgi:ribonucleoside-diphosphate reductase alpha chain
MGDGTVLPEVSAVFQQAAQAGGYYSDELMESLTAGERLANRAEVPELDRARFATAFAIAPEWHVRMQAAFQSHTDLAVSKTVNLPHEASVEDVRAVYSLAHELGCKGVTVYRDGSRAVQVLAHVGQDSGTSVAPATTTAVQVKLEPRRRNLADKRQSLTHKFRVGEQEGYLTMVLYEDGSPGEVFIQISKEASTASWLTDTVALRSSTALKYGVNLGKLEQARFEPYGITLNTEIPFTTSLLDYVFRWLRLHFRTPVDADSNGWVVRKAEGISSTLSGLTCPDCRMQVVHAEGCLLCESCGYSKCG